MRIKYPLLIELINRINKTDLGQEVKDEAIKHLKLRKEKDYPIVLKQDHFRIDQMFMWNEQPQGWKFWSNIHEKIKYD